MSMHSLSSAPELNLLAINLTRRCNLACAHCYLDATTLKQGDDQELTTGEVQSLLEEVAERNEGTLVVLTGGEPLLRRDLESIIEHGSKLELPMVVGTNGVLLSPRRIASLQETGLLGAGISLDSLDADYHDQFRGQQGSWQRTLDGIENCRRAGFSFQLHFSINDENAHELEAMITFARSVGAQSLNVFFLVCTGRGQSFSNIESGRYETILRELIEHQAQNDDLVIRPRCAPHFKRIAAQLNPDSELNQISGRDGDGCIAGLHYARIQYDGGVTPCPYIEAPVGNLRETPFNHIWSEAEPLIALREPRLEGRCGKCEYQQLCGGCRARPVAAGGSLMASDDFCQYQPQGGETIIALRRVEGVRWSESAQARLQRVPRFIRKLVKKRAEAYVAEKGESLVTPEHLSQLTARRFGGKSPTGKDHPFSGGSQQ